MKNALLSVEQNETTTALIIKDGIVQVVNISVVREVSESDLKMKILEVSDLQTPILPPNCIMYKSGKMSKKYMIERPPTRQAVRVQGYHAELEIISPRLVTILEVRHNRIIDTTWVWSKRHGLNNRTFHQIALPNHWSSSTSACTGSGFDINSVAVSDAGINFHAAMQYVYDFFDASAYNNDLMAGSQLVEAFPLEWSEINVNDSQYDHIPKISDIRSESAPALFKMLGKAHIWAHTHDIGDAETLSLTREVQYDAL